MLPSLIASSSLAHYQKFRAGPFIFQILASFSNPDDTNLMVGAFSLQPRRGALIIALLLTLLSKELVKR